MLFEYTLRSSSDFQISWGNYGFNSGFKNIDRRSWKCTVFTTGGDLKGMDGTMVLIASGALILRVYVPIFVHINSRYFNSLKI